MREEYDAPVDTIVVDEMNVSDSFFDVLDEANKLLVNENLRLVVDKRFLLNKDCAKLSNISCQHFISEAN